MKTISFNLNKKNLPNVSNFTEQVSKTLGSLKTNSNSLSIKSTSTGATNSGVPLYTIGKFAIKINDSVYDLTPEIHKTLPTTVYDGRSMKEQSGFLFLNNDIEDIAYTNLEDKRSERINCFR